MSARGPGDGPAVAGPSSAFLLAQLGAHAARLFAGLVTELDLSPAHAGLLRAIAGAPGRSQQAIARQLGTPATRLVGLVDELERRGFIERRRNAEDRRHYQLYLTDTGRQAMRSLGRLAGRHDSALLAALDQPERDQLHALLTRIVEQQGLTAGVHPGYRDRAGT
ncbi:MAG: MarR family winged helix-turn-helix transcriptional regulator [Jatrophihabitans sp.]